MRGTCQERKWTAAVRKPGCDASADEPRIAHRSGPVHALQSTSLSACYSAVGAFAEPHRGITLPDSVKRQITLVLLAGSVGGLVCAAAILVVLLAIRPTVSGDRNASQLSPASQPTLAPTPTATPVPETCVLGHPNSSNTIVVELSGLGAADVCNDLTNPIRTTNYLKGTQALASHPWAPHKACQYQLYGLTWTIWDSIDAPIPTGPFARKPGGTLCP